MSKMGRTLKQRQFIKAYIESKGNASYAYKQINPQTSKDNLAAKASAYLKKCQPTITELLDKLGLDDFMLIKYLSDGITAMKYIKNGDRLEQVEDWTNRLRALEMTFKMKGKYHIRADADADKDKPRKATFTKTYEQSNKHKVESKAD